MNHACDGILVEAIVKDVRVDGIEIKVYFKNSVFEQALCKKVVSILPDCVVGMDIVSHWGVVPPMWYCKTGHVKSLFR